jgi:hypothetical protein
MTRGCYRDDVKTVPDGVEETPECWSPRNPVTRALAWWLAAELIRRHPADLREIETHPGGGQYDCISLYRRNSDSPAWLHT